MDAVNIAGFLEFDSIVLRDGLLESSEAVQQIVAEKWPFTKESRLRCSDEASGVGIRVEGEVVYLDVEEEDDQDVDVEGDETASVTSPPANIGSREVGSGVRVVERKEVPDVAEPEKPRSVNGSECSEEVAECGGTSLRSASSPPTCRVCLQRFSSEAARANHVCFLTGETDGSPRSRSYRGEGITGTASSSGSAVRRVPKATTEGHCEPPECEIRSGESDGVPRAEESATGGSGTDSACGGTPTAGTPALTGAGASADPKTDGDTCVYLWKSTLGLCGICGKIFNNNSNLKRHAVVHGGGILLTCDVCGQFFPDRWSLWKHKERHSAKVPAKVYKCSVCGKCVNSFHSLRKHRAQHVQPYVCHVCGESFHRASGLQIHKYLHAR